MKGFTLVELMICVALLTIFLSLGMPGFGKLIERYQSDNSVDSLKSALRNSRLLALEREMTVKACALNNDKCSPYWDKLITAFNDTNNNHQLDKDEQVFFSSDLNVSNGYWQKKRSKNQYIQFSPQGHAFSSATTFLYCSYSNDPSLARQLVINFQGRIRVRNYLNSNGSPDKRVAPLRCRNQL